MSMDHGTPPVGKATYLHLLAVASSLRVLVASQVATAHFFLFERPGTTRSDCQATGQGRSVNSKRYGQFSCATSKITMGQCMS